MEEIKWKYGSQLSDETISAVESRLTVFFPSDYRRLVARHNGGRPKPNAIEIPGKREAVMERLLRLDAEGGDSVQGATAILQSRGYENLVPFASDPFGNLFCFRFVGADGDFVVYWEHESGEVTTIAKSLSDFLEHLQHPRN